ncbi:hypothetical protein [Sutterella wadsworthensis]|uniref:hypothetical protein n=1 Tax=Sutterella wadsworthensis TaxID=40545 RepID=UPI001F1077D8|nr:hypothetical protein [Sutterella wadsworthensis]
MKQFAMTAAAAAAVMMMNPAFAADAAYEADLCVIGAGASGPQLPGQPPKRA